MIFRNIFFLFFFACSHPQKLQTINERQIPVNITMPVWIEYSTSTPDSLRDFLKIYLQTKNIKIVEMKEAIEMIMSHSNKILMNKMQSGNISSEKEIAVVVEESMKTILCSKLGIKLYHNQKEENLIIDSVSWNIVSMPASDTSLKIRNYIFYPSTRHEQNIFLQWKSFADTVLASGLLK